MTELNGSSTIISTTSVNTKLSATTNIAMGKNLGVGSSNGNNEAFGFSSIEAAVNIGTQEFIKGFVAGQVTLGVLVFFLVRAFFFQRSAEVRGDDLLHNRKNAMLRSSKNNPTLNNQASEYNILAKTGYDLHRHPDETCDWLNVLIAQILSRYRADDEFIDKTITLIDTAMNGDTRPSFMGYIYITDFQLGREFPHFSNCRIRFAEKTGNLRVEASFNFDDQITLGVDTHLLINWPKSNIAALPISLNVSVVKFSGRLALEIITDQESSETYAYVSILPGYSLEFDVRSLLGNRTKVKDLPKLSFLLITKLQTVFVEELVYPCGKKIKIPMLHGHVYDSESPIQSSTSNQSKVKGVSSVSVSAGMASKSTIQLTSINSNSTSSNGSNTGNWTRPTPSAPLKGYEYKKPYNNNTNAPGPSVVHHRRGESINSNKRGENTLESLDVLRPTTEEI